MINLLLYPHNIKEKMCHAGSNGKDKIHKDDFETEYHKKQNKKHNGMYTPIAKFTMVSQTTL